MLKYAIPKSIYHRLSDLPVHNNTVTINRHRLSPSSPAPASALTRSWTLPSLSTSVLGDESYQPLGLLIRRSAQALNSSCERKRDSGFEFNVLYLSSTAHSLCPVITLAPAVASHVAPLEDAEVAGEAGGQSVSQLVILPWPRTGRVIPLAPRLQVEEVLVKAGLCHGSVPPVVGAQPGLEVSLVVGGELHLHLDHAVHSEVGA